MTVFYERREGSAFPEPRAVALLPVRGHRETAVPGWAEMGSCAKGRDGERPWGLGSYSQAHYHPQRLDIYVHLKCRNKEYYSLNTSPFFGVVSMVI